MGEEETVVVQQVEQESEVQQAGQASPEPEVEHPMKSLLGGDFDFKALRRGQIVEGVVVQVHSGAVLVDVGSKSEGIIAGREIERLGPEGLAAVHEGDTLLVYVLNPEGRNGNPILSLSRAQAERDWREAEEFYQAGKVLERTVAGYNKGGLIVRMGKVRGFVPSSQVVSLRGRRRDPDAEEDPLAQLVGQELHVKVIEIDRNRNRLILSERAAMRESRKLQKEKLLAELKEGDVRTGQVISLCDFGAFVDLGGADGLIHLSELSWRRVAHPADVLTVGDEVQVHVINVDLDRKRIGLSLKRLEKDPWYTIAERYHVGQLIEGTITKVVKFGAFARIFEDDIEGLIHLSELSEERIVHPKEVVQEGDVRTLRIIRIDSDQRRIGLSLKRVASPEYADADWQDAYDQEEEAEEGEVDAEAALKAEEGEVDAEVALEAAEGGVDVEVALEAAEGGVNVEVALEATEGEVDVEVALEAEEGEVDAEAAFEATECTLPVDEDETETVA